MALLDLAWVWQRMYTINNYIALDQINIHECHCHWLWLFLGSELVTEQNNKWTKDKFILEPHSHSVTWVLLRVFECVCDTRLANGIELWLKSLSVMHNRHQKLQYLVLALLSHEIGTIWVTKMIGPFRDSNPGPPAPEAGIIPLDQTDASIIRIFSFITYTKLDNLHDFHCGISI